MLNEANFAELCFTLPEDQYIVLRAVDQKKNKMPVGKPILPVWYSYEDLHV